MSKATFSANKQGDGTVSFICACGSAMWDNRVKKTNPKGPDLKCKSQTCTLGKGGTPNAVWLDKDQKKEYAEQPKPSVPATSAPVTKTQPYAVGDRFGGEIPVSMYTAWAKDFTIYLAQAQGLKTLSELDNLYRECLLSTKKTLAWFKTQIEGTQPSTQSVSPKTVKTPEPVKKDPSSPISNIGPDDVDLSGLDDVDI